jgi:predicted regulator of Ras-like GTPase activity (Roadblock/LC7/MglB family)
MSRLLDVPVARQGRQGSGMSRLDELNRILRKLQIDSPGIETSALISEDGLMIAHAENGAMNMEETRVAGMAATLLNLGTRAAMELSRGAVQEVIVRGENGYAVVLSAGRGTLLLAVTNEASKLGLIFFDMREAIWSLQKVL